MLNDVRVYPFTARGGAFCCLATLPIVVLSVAWQLQVACTALRSAISGGKVDRSIRRGAKWLLRCVTNQWDELSERIEADKAAQVCFKCVYAQLRCALSVCMPSSGVL